MPTAKYYSLTIINAVDQYSSNTYVYNEVEEGIFALFERDFASPGQPPAFLLVYNEDEDPNYIATSLIVTVEAAHKVFEVEDVDE
ncbi:hypothetical protein [Chitinophaga solisilvae]|uniref:hypothetical protein n=1 Tax=Chitinophaga solisilvae TaxID=1233460 RepID=UPI00136C371A|nr:hypothetical protein [Chitinophaga solisilvae]